MNLEEWIEPEQILANGKRINLSELIAHTKEQYRQSRRLYNLRTRRVNGEARQIPLTAKTKTKNSKYSAEDLRWIVQHKSTEIAAHYKISIKQAYAVKHYAKTMLFG